MLVIYINKGLNYEQVYIRELTIIYLLFYNDKPFLIGNIPQPLNWKQIEPSRLTGSHNTKGSVIVFVSNTLEWQRTIRQSVIMDGIESSVGLIHVKLNKQQWQFKWSRLKAVLLTNS